VATKVGGNECKQTTSGTAVGGSVLVFLLGAGCEGGCCAARGVLRRKGGARHDVCHLCVADSGAWLFAPLAYVHRQRNTSAKEDRRGRGFRFVPCPWRAGRGLDPSCSALEL